MPMSCPKTAAALAVPLGAALLAAPAANAGDLPPRPYKERYLGGGDPYARPSRKVESYGPAWHQPHRWPEHRSKGTYVGIPVYPYWRVPAVTHAPADSYDPGCRWERVYGLYRDKEGFTREGWHKVPICS